MVYLFIQFHNSHSDSHCDSDIGSSSRTPCHTLTGTPGKAANPEKPNFSSVVTRRVKPRSARPCSLLGNYNYIIIHIVYFSPVVHVLIVIIVVLTCCVNCLGRKAQSYMVTTGSTVLTKNLAARPRNSMAVTTG